MCFQELHYIFQTKMNRDNERSSIIFHLDLHCGDGNLIQVFDLHDGLVSRDWNGLYNATRTQRTDI